MKQWSSYRIIPMIVEARQVQWESEVIEVRGLPRRVPPGDWIIRLSNGELRSCTNATLAECYEKMDSL